MAKTRKQKKTGLKDALTIPDLRKRFDMIEEFSVKHNGDVKGFQELWKKMFGKSVSEGAARDYLAYARQGSSSSGSSATQKGGALPLAGAPLDYQVRPGAETPYGNFPPYVVSGFQYQGFDSQNLTKIPTLTPPAGLGSDKFPEAITGQNATKQSGGARKSRAGRRTRKQKGGSLPSLFDAAREAMSRPFGMGAPPNAAQDAQMLAKGVNSLSSPRPEIPGPFVTAQIPSGKVNINDPAILYPRV